MSAAVPSPLRAGTKSCSECRRRKVKCTWTSPNARACRRCEERGSTCESQVRTSDSKEKRKLSSKERITRLEAQLGRLNGVVVSLQSRLDYQPSDSAITANAADGFESHMHDVAGDDDDKSSSDSEVVEEDLPTHLYSLFENDVLSTDVQKNTKIKHEQNSRSVMASLNTARAVLQNFIPPRSDIQMKSGHVLRWQRLLHELLPLASPLQSAEELSSSYDAMIQPDVDAITLASWLLGIAVVTQHVQPEDSSPNGFVRQYQNRSNHVRTLSETVETHILSHDSLIGTVKGVGLALLNARAQVSTHPMHKTYLNLRRVTAFAELIGLPRAAKIFALHANDQNSSQDPTLEVKAALWTSICSVNKVLCVILNFPCASLPHSTTGQSLVVDGVVQSREYISHLSEIAAKVHDIDDLSTEPGMEAELYASVLRRDTDLRLLYAKVPQQWWSTLPDEIQSSHVLQFMHYCVVMRVHLICTLRRDRQGKYSYIRQAGLHACHEVAQRWLKLRKSFPLGFFICRVIDIQAFTAAMVLLLASKQAQINGVSHIPEAECLPQVMALMEEKARDQVGSDIAAQAVNVIHSLTGMLNRGESDTHGSLKLTIPRLGKIHVWCNERAGLNSRPSETNSQQASSRQTWHESSRESLQSPSLGEMSNGFQRVQSSGFVPADPVSWIFENDYGAMFDVDFLGATFDFPENP